jgi:hypothetical protein
MSIIEKPENPITAKPSVVTVVPFGWLADEGRYLFKGLAAYPLYALLFGALALFTLAYQIPQDFGFKLGPEFTPDFLYVTSFDKPESNGEFGFRWSSDESYLRFPGAGRLPHSSLEITMQVGGRPADQPPPKVEVWAGGRRPGEANVRLGEVTVGPGSQVYRFDYRPEKQWFNGDLFFALKTPSAFKDKNHNLPLGVVVTEARLRGGPEGNRPVIPALPHLGVLLAGLLIFYLALVRAGWSTLASARWAGLLALGAALALAFARFQLTPALESLFLTMLVAYPLMALGLRVTQFWLRDLRFWILDFGLKNTQLKTSDFAEASSNPENSIIVNPQSPIVNCWLGLIFFSAFVVKAAGLNHPAFLPIDHWFRLHQILRFWDSPAAFWQQYFNVTTGQTVTGLQGGSAVLGQWGVSFSLPYSPLFYLFAAPLALIWPTHDPNLFAAVNLLATWLEASSVFLIYIIAREAFPTKWGGRAGLIAGALYGFYPLSFLLFSDGGYNSILAHWLTLLFVALLFKEFNFQSTRRKSGWLNLWLILALGAALLAHTSTLLLLGSLVVTAAIIFSLLNWLLKKKTGKPSGSLWLITVGGFGVAFVLYYGWYIFPFVRDSLPLLLGKLNSGGIGQDRKLLGTDLLTGFWPQLWEHFRLFPFLLTLIFIGFTIYDLRFTIPESNVKRKTQHSALSTQHSKLTQSSILFFVSWMLVFLGFSLLDLKVNLLQKHMLFAAPLLCLGSGFVLSWLWEWATSLKTGERRAGWLVGALTGLFIGFIIWQGVALWYARVFYYTLPPGSG